jgi:hypothetical protein
MKKLTYKFVPIFHAKPKYVLPSNQVKFDLINKLIYIHDKTFDNKKEFEIYLLTTSDGDKWFEYYWNWNIINSDTYFNNIFFNIKYRYNIEFK